MNSYVGKRVKNKKLKVTKRERGHLMTVRENLG